MKRALLVGLAAAILALLWWRTGWRELGATCATLDPAWLAATLAMLVPQTLLSGLRWSWIAGAFQPVSLGRATEMVLASSALNVVLPSKLGDIVKGAFLDRDRPGGDPETGIALGIFEKGLDTAALCALLLLASAGAPPEEPLGWALLAGAAAAVLAFAAVLAPAVARRVAARAAQEGSGLLARAGRLAGRLGRVVLRLRERPARLRLIVGSAVVLWALHLVQFSLGLRATGAAAPLALVFSRVPMALLVGLLPVTFAGIGTRDAAFVYFLGGPVGSGPALALGVLATLRYVLVAVAGLPFVPRLRRPGRGGGAGGATATAAAPGGPR